MRIIILSNRLKVTVKEENNKINYNPSSGGLVSGLTSYLKSLNKDDYLWVGWTGDSNYSDPESIKKELIKNHNSYPVFVDSKEMDLFYQGFCNKTIWPLFHYFPYLTVYDDDMWDNYKKINQLFADAVLELIEPGDIVWVQDYHFMLVPEIIKKARPDVSIGFFLHIPFPVYEIFRLLPRKWGKRILNGILHSDLVGFHTQDYAQYFLHCVLRILGYNHNLGLVSLEHKVTKVENFPMGIDYKKYNESVNLALVKKEKTILSKSLKDVKVIFSVDRQDYTKGIINRLEGFWLFLKNNPQWLGKVKLVIVVVPSRIGVDEYQEIENKINQLIGKINGDFGNIHWSPIIFQYKNISFEQLIALYNISDVGLVTPLRDGMNLVAKEYIAAQSEQKGVLILSEMTGAAMELGESIIINPNNQEEIAEAIKTALEMPLEEQANRINIMQSRLKKYDIKKWAKDFLIELSKVRLEQGKYHTSKLNRKETEYLITKFKNAKKLIIFLDYDGTLVPFSIKPADAIPSNRLKSILQKLADFANVKIVINSGRDRKVLEEWFGELDISLIAEHGALLKEPGQDWQTYKKLDNSWKSEIIRELGIYVDRLSKSFIEEKEYSVVWHFRDSDNEMSEIRTKEFIDSISKYTNNLNIEILKGNNVLEIKCSGVSKGSAATKLIENQNYDFIMAAGDDYTDESLFNVLPKFAFTIKVGKQKSCAKYYLNSNNEMLDLLEKIANSETNLLEKIFKIFKS